MFMKELGSCILNSQAQLGQGTISDRYLRTMNRQNPNRNRRDSASLAHIRTT